VIVEVRFYGHACFRLCVEHGPSICIDPYRPGSLGGSVILEPIPDTFDYIVCSHGHVDHSATNTMASGQVLDADYETQEFSVRRHQVFHDEFGGRLRGGTTDILTFDLGEHRIVHMGDIGERLTAQQIADWQPGSIDLLLVPVGGYFTLGADGAFELVEKLRPSFVVPCHAANQGVTLPQLADYSHFTRRFRRNAIISKGASVWTLPATETDRTETTLVFLEAAQLPDGRSAQMQ
jgi:L-ascorbate metabolism protein UlaG (beta-lactamase superfamily)